MYIFIENRIVVIGGYQGSSYGTSGTEIINEEKQLTCNIPSFPYSVYHHSATIIPTGILVCGGISSSWSHYKKCYQYKQSTSSWESFPSMTTERYSFDMKYLNQGIWAVGGQGGSTSHYTMDYFNMTSNLWTRRALPVYNYEHCLTQISEYQLILLGGYTSGYGSSVSET